MVVWMCMEDDWEEVVTESLGGVMYRFSFVDFGFAAAWHGMVIRTRWLCFTSRHIEMRRGWIEVTHILRGLSVLRRRGVLRGPSVRWALSGQVCVGVYQK